MKIVRYKKHSGNSLYFGELWDDEVYNLIGDPLHAPRRGEKVADLDEVELVIPCSPTKVLAAAMNYSDKPDLDPNMTEPLVFLKTPASLCGPNDDIVSPFSDKKHWGEPEVAVIIRRTIFRPTKEEVRDAILGYTSANDVTAENVDGLNHHLTRSKAADTFCPIGEFIDTDYDFKNKELKGYHADSLLFFGNTNAFIWDPFELVYQLAQYITLEPWDIILTGSPATQGDLSFLEDGELFSVYIEGLPILKNKFRVI